MPPVPPPRSSIAPRSHSVLVVDDNVDSAEMLQLMLEGWGHEVALAHDGEAALEQIKATKPEVVLLDIGLPGMDGCEVARAVRDRYDYGPRLVALTGYGDEQNRARVAASGFDHHLVKPINFDALAALLAAI